MRRRKLFVALALALVATAIAVPVYATHSDEAGVSATVTPAFLSITFTAQHVGYGTLDLSVTNQLPSGQTGSGNGDAAFVVTNNGTKTANWAIIGGASGAWTIAAAAGTNIYAQRYDTAGTAGGVPTPSPTSLNASSALGTGIAANGTVAVWLELDMPTDVAPGTGEQTLPITIVASAA